MRAWKSVVDALVAEKSKFVFGLIAGPWEFWDYLSETDIQPILVRHDASAVFMAMANARLTGRPGICLNSQGPGVANLFPGYLEAMTGCIPVITASPTSEMKTEGMGQFQETDMAPVFRQVSKWAYRITRPEKIPWAMRRAFTISTAGKPGPVFMEIPFDVGNAEYSGTYTPAVPIPRTRPEESAVSEALKMIGASERPVIVAGGGVILSRATNELVKFAEASTIPVLTTPSGRGSIPEDHPLAVGLVGLYRTRVGKKVYEDADLIISVGSKNEEFQTGGWTYFPKEAKFIQIDIDGSEIGRNFVPNLALVGDAKATLHDLLSGWMELKSKNERWSRRAADIEKAKKEFEAVVEEECKTGETPIRTKRVVWELNRVFGKDTILANENGSQDLWSYYFPYYKVLNTGGCLGMPEQTHMGMGVVGAIAAKLTRPDMKVVCTTGDGAFQLAMKEIPTAVQYNAPVTWVVLNNNALGWEKYYQKYWLESGKFTGTEFKAQPDFVKIAEANKCYGERIERPDDITPALQRALKANTKDGVPAIMDFVVGTFDFPEAFHEFHEVVWGKPVRPVGN
jgi:acetolactate synthase I/II/III large subunit